MSADANIKTIQAVYEAFGRGDGPFILSSVTDDVDWASDTGATSVPWYGIRHGKDAVAAFFSDFGSNMEVQQFEPFSFTANDTEVHTMVRLVATQRSSGRTISMNLHHFFRFRDGQIAYYRGSEDTAQMVALFQS